MTGPVSEYNVIIPRAVEIEAFESTIDGQYRFGFAIGGGGEIPGLALGKADHPGGRDMDLKGRGIGQQLIIGGRQNDRRLRGRQFFQRCRPP